MCIKLKTTVSEFINSLMMQRPTIETETKAFFNEVK